MVLYSLLFDDLCFFFFQKSSQLSIIYPPEAVLVDKRRYRMIHFPTASFVEDILSKL